MNQNFLMNKNSIQSNWNFIGVGLTPSPCRHAYPRLPRTTPPLQEQHSQLLTIFTYLPLTERALPCVMSSPPTLRSLPPSDDIANPNPAANLSTTRTLKDAH